MSSDWLQHALLMVAVVVILDVCVSKLNMLIKICLNKNKLIKICFKNICLIILTLPDIMLFTVLT